MTTISFKAKDELKTTLTLLADRKGINTSAYLKLLLTEALQQELSRVTENGFTVAEEIALLKSDVEDETEGSFSDVESLKKSLLS